VLRLKDAFRRPGMPLSVGLHGAVLAASIITFASPKTFEDVSEAVSVEVIDASALREMTRGETSVRQPLPTPRVDRVDDKREQNAPGDAKRQVNADTIPKPQEATAKEERKEVTAALPLPPPKPPEPPKVAAVAKPPKPAETTEEEEDAEEVIRQAAKKREEQKKLEEARRAEEARKQEEQKKIADAKAAEDRRRVEDTKKAQEAAKKAADEKKKREADQEARNQATADAARRALLASREVPANSGNTGQQVQRTPAAGAPAATGQRMNPSDRAALAGLLADQIRSCWSIPVTGKPPVLPQVRVALNADGSLGGTPTLINASADPNFRALAESGMRAIRQCSPFRIPQRFAPTYDDWRNISVQLNPDD
jgi:colicin import membrane protein